MGLRAIFGRKSGAARLLACAALVLSMLPAGAEGLRVATYSPDLTRKGPGLLLRDIGSGDDEQVNAAAGVIAAVSPDILLLTGFDWDHDGLALEAFANLLADVGADYPHRFAARPNSGLASGLDLDGDGRLGTGDDAQGFGLFTGQGGMALLSRIPLGEVIDYSDRLWRDLPGNLMPETAAHIVDIQRLSSTAHWDIAVETPVGPLHLLAWSATPPVFDGPEDRNGRRNHDEAAFWLHHLPDAPFVLIGDANLDVIDGDGRPEALRRLIAQAQDPMPRGDWQPPQDGANSTQRGDPALDTADWPDADGPGNLRVDYVLPSTGLRVTGAGVFWPDPTSEAGAMAAAGSRHRLVWVDIGIF